MIMATGDPILTALTRMEERLVERLDEWRRELRLDMNSGFDAVHQRLDRLEQEYEMLKAGMARLEADVGTLKLAVARLEKEMAFVRGAIERLEARAERDRADRADLRDQALECRRRLDALEERVQEIEGRLPPD
jgi:chromosome segregation ATPase